MKKEVFKKARSMFLTLTMIVSLCVGFSTEAYATGGSITAAAQGTYTESDAAQDITIRLNVSGVTIPYCAFVIEKGIEVPEGFAIKSFYTSNTVNPINASHYNTANGKVTYSSALIDDTIPADTYYEAVITAPAGAVGDYTVKFKDVSVANLFATNVLANASEVVATFTIEAVAPSDGPITSEKPIVSEEPTTPVNPFIDVMKTDYYYDAVLWAVEDGVTKGTTATTFRPTNPCTRAQMVTFLWRAAGSPEAATKDCSFTDVDKNAYYYDAVLWAIENGVTNGTTATTFSPNNPCTRAQMVTFIARFAKGVPNSETNNFVDVPTNVYYTDAVQWAVETGVTNGTTATTFSPNNVCTRGQMVTFLYRHFEK